jgi:preprotein translocase subunit SecG
MSRYDFFLITVVISLFIIVYVFLKTRRLDIPKSQKVTLYILTFFFPIIGLFLYFYTKRKLKSEPQ